MKFAEPEQEAVLIMEFDVLVHHTRHEKPGVSLDCFYGCFLQRPTHTRTADKLCLAAIELTQYKVVYSPAYVVIPYPNGDVPANTGVCTDVIIRVYRKLGIDLQKEVHEDMVLHFSQYPKDWGMKHPDKNIDHRRVPNLMTFFTRKGCALAVTQKPADYKPGDLVTWDLGGRMTHIGLVINRKSNDGSHYLIVHNIGNGQEVSDCLFRFKIIGHYRYLPQD